MERRRLLDNDGYIDWLKSIGCVLYLPFAFNGDLTDRISGQSLIVSGNGSIVWDNNEQMYKITQSSILWQYVARLENGLNNTWFTNNKYSTCHQIKMVTNSSTKFIASGPSPMTTSSSDTVNAIGAYYNASGRSSGFPRTLAKVAYVCNANEERSYYQGGALYGSYPSYNPYLPSNWVQTSNGVAIALTGEANRYGTQYYGKEYYIFNTALDLTTIRKIQGYE